MNTKSARFCLFLILTLFLAACGTAATPVGQADEAATDSHDGEAAAVVSTNTPIPPSATPTYTPIPPTATFTSVPPTATNTPEPPTNTPAPPTNTPPPPPIGDAANGEVLFNTLVNDAGFSCSQCHNVDSTDRLIGPGLQGIGERAATRVDGLSAIEYIRTSILEPNAYIVEGDPPYPESLMPQVYADVYSDEEINDIIAYLLEQ